MRIVWVIAVVLASTVLAGCGGSQAVRDDNGSGDQASPAQVNTRLGIAYMRRGDHEVALEKLTRAVRQDPEYVDAHTGLAVLYEEINKPDKARDHYEKAADLAPDNGNVHNNLGQLLCKQGEYEAAEEHFLKAVDDPFYDTPAVAYTNAGVCAQRVPDPDRAEEFYRAALEERENYPEALYRLSKLKHENGQWMSARAFLQRYMDAAPAAPRVLLLGVRIERKLGDEKSAAEYAAMLNKQFPDSPEARRLAELNDND